MYILDTNVVSELRKVSIGKADEHVARWAKITDAVDLFLSVITIQELETGILPTERRDPPQGAARLHVPDPRPIRDALIAATALVHGMTVVTRNLADFQPTGVQVLNPWQFPRYA